MILWESPSVDHLSLLILLPCLFPLSFAEICGRVTGHKLVIDRSRDSVVTTKRELRQLQPSPFQIRLFSQILIERERITHFYDDEIR